MKPQIFAIGLAISALVASGSAVAQGRAPTTAASFDEASSFSLPSQVNLREIFRAYREVSNTHSTEFYWPENWEKIGFILEGSLGFISSTPFAGGTAIYGCGGPGNWNYFSSVDENCEGQVVVPYGRKGYIATSQLPGTMPLFRCVFRWNGKHFRHFDTLQANCEGVSGAVNNGPLGYVFL